MVVIAFWKSESSYFFALLLTAEICSYFAFEMSYPYIYLYPKAIEIDSHTF